MGKKGKFSIGQKTIKNSELGGRTALQLLEIASSIIWQNLIFLIARRRRASPREIQQQQQANSTHVCMHAHMQCTYVCIVRQLCTFEDHLG